MTGTERLRIVNPHTGQVEFAGTLDEAKQAMQRELAMAWIPSFTDLLHASCGLIVQVL